MKKKRLTKLKIFLIVLCLYGIWRIWPTSMPDLQISKATTLYNEPLREDGYVDYLKIMNDINSEGVTPENNAAVPLFKVLDDYHFNPEYQFHLKPWQRKEIYGLLGIPAPDTDTPQFTSFGSYKKANNIDTKASPKKYEEVVANKDIFAGWIDANQRVITQLERESERDDFYYPLVPLREDGYLNETLFPHIRGIREIINLLYAQGCIAIAEKDTDTLLRTIKTITKIGAAISRSHITIMKAIASRYTYIGLDLVSYMGTHGLMTKQAAEELNTHFARIEILDNRDEVLRSILIGDLDAAQILHHNLKHPESTVTIDNDLVGYKWKKLPAWKYDVNVFMKRTHEQLNNIKSQLNNVTIYKKTMELIRQNFENARARTNEYENNIGFYKIMIRILANSNTYQNFISSYMAEEHYDSITTSFLHNYLYSLRQGYNIKIAKAAIAIMQYQTEHGKLPESLDVLKPDYLDEIPADPAFPSRKIKYVHHEDMFALCIADRELGHVSMKYGLSEWVMFDNGYADWYKKDQRAKDEQKSP